MKEILKNYINRYVAFTEEETTLFYGHLNTRLFSKKQFLLREGEICRNYYFILSGLVRSFYIDDKGNEKITQFAIENWWMTNIESFIKVKPSFLNIQALEETTALYISKENLDLLYTKLPKLERFFRIITERMLIAKQRRYEFYMKASSKEKYDLIVKKIPDFVQRVPQYMIASYLEITPEYLSQLRKNR